MKIFFILLGILFFVFTGVSYASDHFVYIIREDGVYIGGYGGGGKVTEVDLGTFELIGVEPNGYGPMYRFVKDKIMFMIRGTNGDRSGHFSDFNL